MLDLEGHKSQLCVPFNTNHQCPSNTVGLGTNDILHHVCNWGKKNDEMSLHEVTASEVRTAKTEPRLTAISISFQDDQLIHSIVIRILSCSL
jgi:hypothetical protein